MKKERFNSSQIAIHRAFIAAWKEREYSKISVRRICELTPIARTTFYTYYHNIDELREEVEDALISGLDDAINKADKNIASESLKFAIDYLTEYFDEFSVFLIARPNLPFLKKWYERIYDTFYNDYKNLENNTNFELLMTTLSATAFSIFLYYFKHPDKFDKNSLLTTIEKTNKNLILINQYDIDIDSPLLKSLLKTSSE